MLMSLAQNHTVRKQQSQESNPSWSVSITPAFSHHAASNDLRHSNSQWDHILASEITAPVPPPRSEIHSYSKLSQHGKPFHPNLIISRIGIILTSAAPTSPLLNQ